MLSNMELMRRATVSIRRQVAQLEKREMSDNFDRTRVTVTLTGEQWNDLMRVLLGGKPYWTQATREALIDATTQLIHARESPVMATINR